ncbi:MAG: proteasome subunit beta [uncultured DHVE6 group euryarchaeote]|jgi:proteasome beta subunit|nr:MAG: proteasome subunit beta [uncultured DHVE6 group euryarchaeote]
MNNQKIEPKKGTTTLAMRYNGGVVLATDNRVTMGHMIISKVDKVFPITEFLAMTTAGTVSDNQVILKHLQAEMKLYELESNKKATLENLAAVLQNIIYSGFKSYQPFMMQNIIAGMTKDGSFRLRSLDPSGASIEDPYTATGSGMMFVLGLMQDAYKENMSESEAVDLAVRSIHSAIQRDSASGDGISIAVIDKKGYRRLPDKNISMILSE